MKNNKTLLVGPWVGEFGWELFCWQGFARNLGKDYSKVIVISREGHKFLYEDFCDEFISYNPPVGSSSDSWMCKGDDEIKKSNIIKSIKHDFILRPQNIGFHLPHTGRATMTPQFKAQKFVKLASDTLEEGYDIIVHARNKKVGGSRNWDKKNWQDLVNLLSEKFTVATIGGAESFSLDNAVDRRNLPIEDTVSLMNRCNLVVGQSSGPIHLASLSEAPHFVWSSPHNRVRYENVWNPFKTPVYFYDKEGWNPNVNNIYKNILEYYEKTYRWDRTT